ncbi:MAG: hypothetical protein GY765_42885, partial [bacterium]|nr:hypothetical protein [bacterium]
DYKKYAAQFSSPRQFLAYANNKKSPLLDIEALEGVLKTPGDIEAMITPLYAYSKDDVKDFKMSKEVKNFVLGVTLECEEETPERTREYVRLLGEYIRDNVLYGKLKDYINAELNTNVTEGKRLDNHILKDQFKLEQLKLKLATLKQLAAKYPVGKLQSNRELLNHEDGGYRFLPPATQVVGVESYIADIVETLAHNTKYKQIADLKVEFLQKAREMLEKETMGFQLLDSLLKMKETFFQSAEAPENVSRTVDNDFVIDFAKFSRLKDHMDFIAASNLPKTPIKPRKSII